MGEAFLRWQRFARESPVFDIGRFPSLVPNSRDEPAHEANTAAWDVLLACDRPFLCAFSDGDRSCGKARAMFIGRVPGTTGQPHTAIEGAGHFLQEDKGEQLAQVVADFIAAT